MTRPDLIGEQFGYLTVVELSDKILYGRRAWRCKCKCGNTVYALTNSLRSGNTKSCGCYQKEQAKKTCSNDLVGQKFGKLTVLRETEQRLYGNIVWECECECGNIIYTTTSLLTQHKKYSCGCTPIYKPVIDLTGQLFGDWEVLECDGKHEDGFYYWKCKCIRCGQEKTVRGNNLKTGDSTNCGCEKSKGEKFVNDWLIKNNFQFQREYSFSNLYGDKQPLRFDFYVNSKLIEVMGVQHYYEVNKFFDITTLKRYDQKKKEYCNLHNIPLLYLDYNKDSSIPYNKWERQLQDFLFQEGEKLIVD